MSFNIRWSLPFVLICCLQALPAQALVISGFDTIRHSRFASGFSSAPVENPDFFAGQYDWSGVGWGANNTKTVTMITPQHFVTAAHHKPSENTPVYFVNAEGVLKSYMISHYSPTTTYGYTSDVVVGWLTEAIPEADHINNYPLVTSPNNAWYYGREIFVYGRNAQVGRNIIDGISSTSTSSNPTYVAYYYYDNATDSNGLGIDEAGAVAGDSSGPSFAIWQDQIALVGTHFAVSGSPPSRYRTYDAMTVRYLDQIQTIIEPSGQQLTLLDGQFSHLRPGDFTNDGLITTEDIDAILQAIIAGSTSLLYDLDHNGRIEEADGDYLIYELLQTGYGDTNLDGEVTIADLTVMAEHYGAAGTAGWATGDFNGDRIVGIGDLSVIAEWFSSNPLYGLDGVALTTDNAILLSDPNLVPLPGALWAAGALLGLIGAARRRAGRGDGSNF